MVGDHPRRVGGEDRWSLSQLLQYMARPPIAESRLERTATGDILYKLKTPWSDGTIGIHLSPSELIEKLIALIPPRSTLWSAMVEPLLDLVNLVLSCASGTKTSEQVKEWFDSHKC